MMKKLPIDDILENVIHTLETHQNAVLHAPPGSGKTTRVPLALLNANFLSNKRIIMLEPRRLAARSAALYMAKLLNEDVGQTIGYRTRLDSKISANTKIEVVTEGILTRLLMADESLENYGLIIFDEFHERSLQGDMGLLLSKECQSVLRPDLRLLIMSATLDIQRIESFLPNTQILICPSPLFPVSVFYRPCKALEWQDTLIKVMHECLEKYNGSILIFLPGESEIRRAESALQSFSSSRISIWPLYGQLSLADQDAAIQAPKENHRKIVLATAIAETSLTIEGIEVVIDIGLQRVAQFDPNSAMSRLITQRVSAASAEQRRGRAGRLQAGACFRLWSEEENTRLNPFSSPEIMQADLSAVVLELAKWGFVEFEKIPWLDAPPLAHWQQAQDLLKNIQAIDTQGRITQHGAALIELGLPPRLAHMVIRGRALGHGILAAQLAALLSERDVLRQHNTADISDRLHYIFNTTHNSYDKNRLQKIKEGARQLSKKQNLSEIMDDNAIGELLALAYPDRIAQKRKNQQGRYILSNGKGAILHTNDRLRNEDYLVVADLDGKAQESTIYLATSIQKKNLEKVLEYIIYEKTSAYWHNEQKSVIISSQKYLGALILEEKFSNDASRYHREINDIFLQEIKKTNLDIFEWGDDLKQWQARAHYMHTLYPDIYPALDTVSLLNSLDVWLQPFLDGYTRFSQLKQLNFSEALKSHLSYELEHRMNQELPISLLVPSGSHIKIDYTSETTPVLSVKLQELFGLDKTPTLAQGKIKLSIHLLSPAQRPVAITQDLASFWRNAYHEVRKDLRGRYPKHPWPEDPLSAIAQKGVKKKMS